jgi:flagellar biosynthesis regulator FlbT
MPAARDLVEVINQHVSMGAFYKALKEIRTLMKREEERSAA